MLNGNKRRVLIGTPSYDGKVEVFYCDSLAKTIRYFVNSNIELYEFYICYDSIVQNARNDIVKNAVDLKYDDLILIDSDQDWQPEWIEKLLSYPVDCVGGTARKRTDKAEAYNIKYTGSFPIPSDPNTGLLKVEGLATGFLRLSRKALLALWNSSEDYMVWKGQPNKWIFDIRPNKDGILVGEDTLLGIKLKELGFETWLDPSITCGHTGSKRFVGDCKKWLQDMKAI